MYKKGLRGALKQIKKSTVSSGSFYLIFYSLFCLQIYLDFANCMIVNYLFDTANLKITFSWISDWLNFTDYVPRHGWVFEGQITVRHLAINEPQILGVTEWLMGLNYTIDKSHVFAVPTNVFTLNKRIFHNYVFTMPKSVFSIEFWVIYP